MRLKDITNDVKRVAGMTSDIEAAHSLEDALHQEVLAYIASGRCRDPQAYAREALKTRDVAFVRVYA